MPIIQCAICGKGIHISEMQLKLMQGTIMTCSNECAVKAIERQDK